MSQYTAKTIDLFWQKVSVKSNDECWEWQGQLNWSGYGLIKIHYRHHRAHRVSWELKYGDIQNDLCVLHKCDNRKCVNPDHLWLGTKTDNAADRDAKGRGRNASMPGEKNPAAKLNENEVGQIRKLYAMGIYTQTKLGALFGVSHATVSQIIRYDTWRE